MNRNNLITGIVLTVIGLCFLIAAVMSENAFDGLFWGFAGAFTAMGTGMVIRYFYWSSPKRAEQYQAKKEQADIELHDERNEQLRDKSGRLAYVYSIYVVSASMMVFCVLGMAGVIGDYKIILCYLAGLMVFQIVSGIVIYNHLKKKY